MYGLRPCVYVRSFCLLPLDWHWTRNLQRENMKRFIFILLTILILPPIPAHAVEENGKCNKSKYGDSKVMSNGKLLDELGRDKNYLGPLYLCNSGYWYFVMMRTPISSPTEKTVNVKPFQGCNKFKRIVESTNYGSLTCKFVWIGKIKALVWART